MGAHSFRETVHGFVEFSEELGTPHSQTRVTLGEGREEKRREGSKGSQLGHQEHPERERAAWEGSGNGEEQGDKALASKPTSSSQPLRAWGEVTFYR